MRYPHIAARIFNTPLLIHPQKLDAIIAGLSERLLGAAPLAVAAADGSRLLAPELFSTRRGEASDRGHPPAAMRRKSFVIWLTSARPRRRRRRLRRAR